MQLKSQAIHPSKVQISDKLNTPKPKFISRFIEINALPISIIMLLAAICYSGVLSFINFYAKELNLVQAASFFFLMYAIAILISRPFTGPLMDRKGENIIIYPAFIIMGVALILLSFAQTSTMLLICASLLGFGYGNIQSVCQTIAVKSASLERMGIATLPGILTLLAGGLAYTIGTYFYKNNKIPYNHAIWHVFVIAGSVAMFAVVYFFV